MGQTGQRTYVPQDFHDFHQRRGRGLVIQRVRAFAADADYSRQLSERSVSRQLSLDPIEGRIKRGFRRP